MQYIEFNPTGKILNLSRVRYIQLEKHDHEKKDFCISFHYQSEEIDFASYKDKEDRSSDYRKIIKFLRSGEKGLLSITPSH